MSTEGAIKEVYTSDVGTVLCAEECHLGKKPQNGIAISGGGIRSAAFNLGVMQALASGGVLKLMDYMSTVSGGGYLGSALTWWLHRGLPDGSRAGTTDSDFPFGTQGSNSAAQQSILDFIRFHRNYLVPSVYVNALSLAAVVIRVAIVALAVYFSWLSIMMLILFYLITALNSLSGVLPVLIGSRRIVDLMGVSDDTDLLIGSWLLGISFFICILFFVGSILYSIFTLVYQLLQFAYPQRPWSSRRYIQRSKMQATFGRVLAAGIIFAMLGLLPIIDGLSSPRLGGPLTVTSCIILGSIIAFWRGRTEPAEDLVSITGIRQLLGTFLLIYSLAMSSYIYSKGVIEDGIDNRIWSLASLIVFAIIIGLLVNVNYLGIHRMYRDRLMELFLPSDANVNQNTWGYAAEADGTAVESVCQPPNARPYHIINCNVVLVDSPKAKYSGRGGDSFMISPLYCGSEATGWCRTCAYMKKNEPGMTLATAMAISGAAANPNTGVAGAGFARNRVVSTLMSLLNLRLGHWAPHPNPAKAWRLPPNFIYPGITGGVLVGRLNENSGVVDLTDGGHFDNLGLYELVRRKLRLIIVCDGSADPMKRCTDLGVAIERARVDFGARINFGSEEPDLSSLRPGSAENNLAKSGFAVATITYNDRSMGTILYIKATITPGLSHDVYSYHSVHAAFPDESTSDQFFNETQFEAYRELGYHLGRQVVEANEQRAKLHQEKNWF